jgi:hypothetical protein
MTDLASLVMNSNPEIKVALHREMTRVFNLPSLWLGYEILRLSRSARSENSDRLGNPYADSAESMAVWRVFPEVARRLGVTKFENNEQGYHGCRSLDDADFRHSVGFTLRTAKLRSLSKMSPSCNNITALQILGSPIGSGNPVAIALDRICPADAEGYDGYDFAAAEMWKVSQTRYGMGVTSWHPDLFCDQIPKSMPQKTMAMR